MPASRRAAARNLPLVSRRSATVTMPARIFRAVASLHFSRVFNPRVVESRVAGTLKVWEAWGGAAVVEWWEGGAEEEEKEEEEEEEEEEGA